MKPFIPVGEVVSFVMNTGLASTGTVIRAHRRADGSRSSCSSSKPTAGDVSGSKTRSARRSSAAGDGESDRAERPQTSC